MLYVFSGEAYWLGVKKKELVSRASDAGDAIFFLAPERFEPIGGYLGGGLFEKKICIFGESLLGEPAWGSEINELLSDIIKSPNIFFLFETELEDSYARKLEDAGAKIQKIKKPTRAKLASWASEKAEALGLKISKEDILFLIDSADSDPYAILNALEGRLLEKSQVKLKSAAIEPNYFNFADAVSAKNKPLSLRLLNSYIRSGLGVEEAFWKLAWKVKVLLQIQACPPGQVAASLGLHPFVIKKSAEDLKKFSAHELREISLALADIFSEVRRGETSFEAGLEKLLLNL